MRKTFPLEHPSHAPPRVLEGIKHEVRKYLKRERRKRLPEDADFWAFDCQVGMDGPSKVVQVTDLIGAIDEASAQGWATVYIEILARPAQAKSPAPTGEPEP
ncbi:MAG: DUF6172 family protein [Myxococcota bacterium]